MSLAPNGSYLTYSKGKNLALYDLDKKQEHVLGRLSDTYTEGADNFSSGGTLLAPPSSALILQRIRTTIREHRGNGDRQSASQPAAGHGRHECIYAGRSLPTHDELDGVPLVGNRHAKGSVAPPGGGLIARPL